MIIGLTGGIGSGKSTVAQFFRELGITILDSDQITRQLVTPDQPAFKAIVEHFGPGILQGDGTLNRTQLRAIIFESAPEKRWLETLLHPMVKEYILDYSRTFQNKGYLIAEIPLLIEAKFKDSVDRILVVDSSVGTQIERVHKRDSIPRGSIQAIIDNQATRAQRLILADDIIENNSTLEALKNKVVDLHKYYIELPN